MILLTDANVIIDIGSVRGLSALGAVAETEILDIVLQECEHPTQPDIKEVIISTGIKVITAEYEWMKVAGKYRTGALSWPDALNLHYAKMAGRVLLTGDKALRNFCRTEGVEVRGTIWLVEELFNRNLLDGNILCGWLTHWKLTKKRLPQNEVERLHRLLGC